jgi:hypothetical protein
VTRLTVNNHVTANTQTPNINGLSHANTHVIRSNNS